MSIGYNNKSFLFKEIIPLFCFLGEDFCALFDFGIYAVLSKSDIMTCWQSIVECHLILFECQDDGFACSQCLWLWLSIYLSTACMPFFCKSLWRTVVIAFCLVGWCHPRPSMECSQSHIMGSSLELVQLAWHYLWRNEKWDDDFRTELSGNLAQDDLIFSDCNCFIVCLLWLCWFVWLFEALCLDCGFNNIFWYATVSQHAYERAMLLVNEILSIDYIYLSSLQESYAIG